MLKVGGIYKLKEKNKYAIINKLNKKYNNCIYFCIDGTNCNDNQKIQKLIFDKLLNKLVIICQGSDISIFENEIIDGYLGQVSELLFLKIEKKLN